MTTELALHDDDRLVSLDGFRAQIEAKREQIREQLAPGCPDGELSFFLEQCIRLRLDPILKQVYFIKRRQKSGNGYADRWTLQVGIDGFRAVADRTEAYAGSDDAEFEYGPDLKPTRARVTVWRLVQGQRCGFTASARWDEYYPGDQQGYQWNRMPHVMLGKVAEALALRKGFPAQLGGVYIHEEMAQADNARVIEGAVRELPAAPLVNQKASAPAEGQESPAQVVEAVQKFCQEATTPEMLDAARDFANARRGRLNADQRRTIQAAIEEAQVRIRDQQVEADGI